MIHNEPNADEGRQRYLHQDLHTNDSFKPYSYDLLSHTTSFADGFVLTK